MAGFENGVIIILFLDRFLPLLKRGLLNLGVSSEFLEFLWKGEGKIPIAKGSIDAVRGQAFFIPLYELFLTYGGVFRLVFGPKVNSFSFSFSFFTFV